MSVTKRIAFGAAASWFSRGMTILMGLLLMPVLFRHLPKEELGVWLLLGQTWSVMGVLDLGISFTLTRRIALAKGKSGGDPSVPLNEETRRDIADLVESGRRIYHWLALSVFLISSVSGFFYLRHLHLTTMSPSVAWMAWLILCLSQGFGVWAQIWNCLLNGVGYIGWDAVLGSFISALTLATQITALFLGGGLIALATVAACGALAQRYLLLGFARNRRPELFKIRGRWNAAAVRSMISPSLRAWLTSLGAVIVLNTDQFFIVQLKGAADLPVYRAAYLILLNLNMLSVTVAGASAVFISHMWQAGELEQVKWLVMRNLRFGLSIMVSGGACVLALGPRLFDFWLRPGHFVGYPILVVFFILLTLEAHCFIVATSSRATEDEAFAPWALAAAALKVLFSWLLGVRYGLLGIALGTLLAELLTNHWFMPYRGLRRLRMSLWQHLFGVLLPVGLVFVMTGSAVWLVEKPLANVPLWFAVGTGVAVAGLVLAVALWLLVLDKSQRVRLLANLAPRLGLQPK